MKQKELLEEQKRTEKIKLSEDRPKRIDQPINIERCKSKE